ncbi:hypothetical protein FDI69_gp248 [Rhodococcus phage Trina]|uniref:Uncharacterized protein n=1 Tax=Rhodococcus phage Trina TaxID=2027905 RepID=A0A2D0ZN12_9CAUD|nr:hypothetical protein FDI69_gp248 [Rhodococcus phage Trina]ASZ74939.1 hypothetical protein SEA_TRINA_131 [Rhodococcus phage Trina]
MKYAIAIGDYSDDGHGKCDRYVVESDKDFDLKDIAKAYQQSRKELGKGIEDIATSYESWPLESDAQVFVDAGLQWPKDWFDPDEDDPEDLAEVLAENWDEDVWVYVFEFMVKRHLPEFNLKIVKSDLPVLFGDWGAVATKGQIGYGTFSM